jgi:release factor glutamine methyltransferase
MSSPPTSVVPASAVARLRAAGCVFAEDEARLLVTAAEAPADLDAMVGRRCDGEPLEQVVGFAEFCGLRIAVAPGVFVPRRRTELLARQAADVAAPGAVVVDLCCGSGAVGAAVAAVADVEVHAVDVEPVAVAFARANLASVGGEVYAGDLFAPLPARLRGRVDVLVTNAPYVPTDAIRLLPTEARRHEPLVALDGGADGLDVLRRVVQEAPDWLAADGHVLVESAADQMELLVAEMAAAGLTATVVRDEETDGTVVIGKGGSLEGCGT